MLFCVYLEGKQPKLLFSTLYTLRNPLRLFCVDYSVNHGSALAVAAVGVFIECDAFTELESSEKPDYKDLDVYGKRQKRGKGDGQRGKTLISMKTLLPICLSFSYSLYLHTWVFEIKATSI